jgi:hypothetical protein
MVLNEADQRRLIREVMLTARCAGPLAPVYFNVQRYPPIFSNHWKCIARCW